MRRLPCFVALTLFTLSCMNPEISYTYADGSANVYILTSTSLEYDPVTPEESSTGTYSGGEPRTVTLSAAEFKSIQVLFGNAINNKSIHINDRIKTSGALSVFEAGQVQQSVILQPGCLEQVVIEKLLKETLSK